MQGILAGSGALGAGDEADLRTALEPGPPRGPGEPAGLRLRLRNDGADPARGTVVVETSTSADPTSIGSERFDYALAPGEVLARDLTLRAPREGEAGAPGELTVQVHSPNSRLQPSRLVVPGPPGDEPAD